MILYYTISIIYYIDVYIDMQIGNMRDSDKKGSAVAAAVAHPPQFLF